MRIWELLPCFLGGNGHGHMPIAWTGHKIRTLFVCTGNACCSQMAEGWAQAIHADRIEPFSAGTAPAGLDPRAVQVMAESGIDISWQASKHIYDLLEFHFDYVITLCDTARDTCRIFDHLVPVIHAGFIHAGFDDPPALARTARSPQDVLQHFRRVRDEIREFVAGLPEALPCSSRACPGRLGSNFRVEQPAASL